MLERSPLQCKLLQPTRIPGIVQHPAVRGPCGSGSWSGADRRRRRRWCTPRPRSAAPPSPSRAATHTHACCWTIHNVQRCAMMVRLRLASSEAPHCVGRASSLSSTPRRLRQAHALPGIVDGLLTTTRASSEQEEMASLPSTMHNSLRRNVVVHVWPDRGSARNPRTRRVLRRRSSAALSSPCSSRSCCSFRRSCRSGKSRYRT